MWKSIGYTSIRERPFKFNFIALLADNKRSYHPWDWYLINLATLVLLSIITFEISKHSIFPQCLI